MSDAILWPGLTALLLGAAHGVNPGMGWLFAVALGLQEGSGRAVWRALAPLAVGHALAVGATILLAALVGLFLPLTYLRWLVAATLLVFGLYKLVRHRHPRWTRMRVGARDLTFWSFLMAFAHGAGLMVLPFVLGATTGGTAGSDALATGTHAMHAEAVAPAAHPVLAEPVATDAHALHAAGLGAGGEIAGLVLTLLHTAGYLLVVGLVALIVYEKLGLRFLRSAWLNLDAIWALALIAAALATPFV